MAKSVFTGKEIQRTTNVEGFASKLLLTVITIFLLVMYYLAVIFYDWFGIGTIITTIIVIGGWLYLMFLVD